MQKNLAHVLGIDLLSVEEQAVYLSEVGDAIFETSLIRLVSNLSEKQQLSIDQYLETEPEPDVLFEYLLEHYENFAGIVKAVAFEFKEDAAKVFEEESSIKIIDAE